MVAAIAAARGATLGQPMPMRRLVLTTKGWQCCRIEGHERTLPRAKDGTAAELRYTEFADGGHDAWTRARLDKRVARWALR